MEPQILNNNESAYTHRTKINSNFTDLADETNEALDRVATVETDKIDKVTNAKNNNIPVLDANGNLKDSGLSVDDFDSAGSVSTHNVAEDAHNELFEEKANKSFALTGTLLASAWSDTAPYSQVLTIQGVTANTNGIIGVSDVATRSQYEVAASANLRKIAQSTNTVTIMAYGEKPTIDIPIEIIVMG